MVYSAQPTEPLDLEGLAACILRPDRSALAAACAAVGAAGPRQAWMALAREGLIPSDWLDTEARQFVVTTRPGARRSNEDAPRRRIAGCLVQANPVRAVDAIALAASACSAVVAEAHAREAARRIGISPHVPVLWRIEPRWRPTAHRWKRFTHHFGHMILGAHSGVLLEAERIARRFAEALRRGSGHNGAVEGDVHMREVWRLASTTPALVPPMLKAWEPWGRFAGQPFADVPNPLDPWIDVWSLGFGIDVLRAEAIVLVAPSDGVDP